MSADTLPPVIPFNEALFRKMFPLFSDTEQFPSEMLDMKWDEATCYISDRNYGRLHDKCRQNALFYMLAHLLYLQVKAAQSRPKGLGARGGVVTGATIDKVSVTLLPPPVQSVWDWWLEQTPFGAQLLALLSSASVGGFYVGGVPEGDAFRKAYGVYRDPTQEG